MRLPENIHSVSGSLGFQVALLGRRYVAHCFYRLYLCYPDVCPCPAIVGSDADLFGGVDDIAHVVCVLGGLYPFAQQTPQTGRKAG